MAAAVGMSTGMALKSSFCGAPLRQGGVVAAKPEAVAFAVRAGGYDEELIKTAVCLLMPFRRSVLMSWFVGLGHGVGRSG